MGFTSQYAPVGWGFVKICNDVKSNPHLGPGWEGGGGESRDLNWLSVLKAMVMTQMSGAITMWIMFFLRLEKVYVPDEDSLEQRMNIFHG